MTAGSGTARKPMLAVLPRMSQQINRVLTWVVVGVFVIWVVGNFINAPKQFISVFITCDDQPDALRAFADTSTKHPQLLGSLKMNVEQVSLGAKGAYYRTLIGEPGTKASAAATCTTLQAAGYRWCRAMPY